MLKVKEGEERMGTEHTSAVTALCKLDQVSGVNFLIS
jgi:hypothetical protein